ncbi:hypothetical protein AAHB54_28730 [Bacillus cereus]
MQTAWSKYKNVLTEEQKVNVLLQSKEGHPAQNKGMAWQRRQQEQGSRGGVNGCGGKDI